LVKIIESELADGDKIAGAILRDWQAIDVETSARLFRSRGRSKYGNAPKWILILPHDGRLFDSRGDWERAVFRADSLDQAIATANHKLPKLILRKERKTRGAAGKETTRDESTS